MQILGSVMFRRSVGGFSLAEILIVVAILGIIAAVVVPSLSSTDPKKLELATSEVAQTLRFARSEAMRLGKPMGLSLQSTEQRIRVFSVDTSTNPWTPVYDVYHPLSKQLYDIQLAELANAAVDTVMIDASYTSSCNIAGNVYFDRYGTPWCTDPDNVSLSMFKIVLNLGQLTTVIVLNVQTGRVIIQ